MDHITLYHGTNPKYIEDIKENGIADISNSYHDPLWYMLSTDFESALFHATPLESGDNVYVVEVKVPIIENELWTGYPYLWKGYERSSSNSNTSTWYALREKIPNSMIAKIHEVDYNTWFSQKNKGY